MKIRFLCSILLLVSSVMLSPLTPLFGAEQSPPAENINIGVIAPLTGNAAHVGAEITRTLSILEEELAKEPLRHSYRFIFEDGKGAVDNSPINAARKLISVDGSRFIISATSGETLQIAPVAERERILVIAVFSSHKDIKQLGDFVFRTSIDVERGMKNFAQSIRENGQIPVALLTEDHAFNRGIRDLLVKVLGQDLSSAEDYQGNEVDLRTVLLKAKSKHPNSYYFNCSHPKTCAIIVNQAQSLGISEPIYSFLHIDNPEFLQAAGENAEGIRFVAPPDVSSSSPRFKQFLSKYQKKYQQGPKNDFLMRTTFDAAWAIIDAVESVGPDSSKVKDYLYSYQAAGALGKVSFDKNGDIRDIDYVIKQIVNRQPELVN